CTPGWTGRPPDGPARRDQPGSGARPAGPACPGAEGAGSATAASPPALANAAATLGQTPISPSIPVTASTPGTAAPLDASRSREPSAVACRTTRTRAVIPAESQNVVAVMSAIT